MRVLCPNCQQMVAVPDAAAGQPTPCPLCGKAFTPPALTGAALDQPPPPAAQTGTTGRRDDGAAGQRDESSRRPVVPSSRPPEAAGADGSRPCLRLTLRRTAVARAV